MRRKCRHIHLDVVIYSSFLNLFVLNWFELESKFVFVRLNETDWDLYLIWLRFSAGAWETWKHSCCPMSIVRKLFSKSAAKKSSQLSSKAQRKRRISIDRCYFSMSYVDFLFAKAEKSNWFLLRCCPKKISTHRQWTSKSKIIDHSAENRSSAFML